MERKKTIDGKYELLCEKCKKNDWRQATQSKHEGIILRCSCGNKIRIVSSGGGDYTPPVVIVEGAHHWEYEIEPEEKGSMIN